MIPPISLLAKVTVIVAGPTGGLSRYHSSVLTNWLTLLAAKLPGTRVMASAPKVTPDAEQWARVVPRSVETPTTSSRLKRPGRPPTVCDHAQVALVLAAPVLDASNSMTAPTTGPARMRRVAPSAASILLRMGRRKVGGENRGGMVMALLGWKWRRE